jgi:predicted RNase H-like HicB family nuclease
MMKFPVVFELEESGAISAYVPGVPGVYAAADTVKQAERGIKSALKAHLRTLEELGRSLPTPNAEVKVLNVTRVKDLVVDLVGAGALLGMRTSAAKATAARANGLKGGRPPKFQKKLPKLTKAQKLQALQRIPAAAATRARRSVHR